MPALIFDCDGVLADTEKDGHLPAFNDAFAEFGLPIRWDEATYAEKLKIGGGKERIAAELSGAGFHLRVKSQADLVRRLHARKTQLFTQRVADALLPPRPGIRRIIDAALGARWTVAVASTSAEPSVRAVMERTVGTGLSERCHVFAGDVVPRKKPAADIYLKVLADLSLDPADCLVVEDSAIGARAAVSAGLTTIVTVSFFTAGDDFTGAALVLSHLGDPANPLTVISAPAGVRPDALVTLEFLQQLLATNPATGCADALADGGRQSVPCGARVGALAKLTGHEEMLATAERACPLAAQLTHARCAPSDARKCRLVIRQALPPAVAGRR